MTEYIGGVRWRKVNATWPFAKLVVAPGGIVVKPSKRWLRFVGVPSLDLRWSDITNVEKVRGVLVPLGTGVSLIVRGKRLIFWCSSATAAAIVQDLSHYVPEKIASGEKWQRVF